MTEIALSSREKFEVETDYVVYGLIDIKNRVDFIAAISADLNEKFPDGARLKNSALWRLCQDSFELAVVDLASWVKRCNSSHGILGILRGDLRLIEVPNERYSSPESITEGAWVGTPPPDEIRILLKKAWHSREKARYKQRLQEMLPGMKTSKNGRPQIDDITKMGTALEKLADRIRDARDNLYAHRFSEDKATNSESRGSKVVSIKEMQDVITRCEEFLNSILLMVSNITWAFGTHTEDPASIVDLLLFGDIEGIGEEWGINEELSSSGERRYIWQFRSRGYQKLIDENQKNDHRPAESETERKPLE